MSAKAATDNKQNPKGPTTTTVTTTESKQSSRRMLTLGDSGKRSLLSNVYPVIPWSLHPPPCFATTLLTVPIPMAGQ